MKSGKVSFMAKGRLGQTIACVLWFVCFMAIRQEFMQPGDDPRLAWVLICLISIPVLIYFLSGTRLHIDVPGGTVKRVFTVLGVPLKTRRIELNMKQLFLLPERTRYFGARQYTSYYHLCLGEYVPGNEPDSIRGPSWQVVKPNFMIFTLAERRLRRLARTLDLPAAIYWSHLGEEFGSDEKSDSDLRSPFVMPKAVRDFLVGGLW